MEVFMNVSGIFSHKSDLWETPASFFLELDKEFKFTLDPCALPFNAKCSRFFSPDDNGLVKSWNNEVVFCNPPYSACEVWVYKAFREWENHNVLTVLLLPARTDTSWFHNYIYGNCEIRFIRGRLRFSGKDNAPFPSMVCIFWPKEVSNGR